MIENLVFSGGGIKCISYIGILKYIEENKNTFNIKKISASSGGALCALCIILKYNYQDLYKLILKINLYDLRDINTDNIFNYLENYGIDTGLKLEQLINIIIEKKNNKSNITFEDFYNKYSIDLTITGTCLNSKNCEYFNLKNTPKMEIAKALRISCSIPFFYNHVKYNNKIYIDGGTIDNYPIDIFKDNIEKTLGFYISTKENKTENLMNFENYIINFLYCIAKQYKIEEKYLKFTVFIESDINIIDFNICNEKKKNLINIGYQSILKYFENK